MGAGDTGGRRERRHGLDALLAVRARFFLTYRVPVRLLQVVAADGAARTAGWRVALVAFVGLDVVLGSQLRNPERFWFGSRLAIDSLDIALWSLALYVPPDRFWLAVFIGTPLALETGIRRPSRALVVPAVTFATTTLVRAVAGRPFVALPFLWLVLAGACGVVLSRYDGVLRRQAQRLWSQRRLADDRRAYLAGLNSVAMGASSVVDGIEGVVPIIGHPRPGSALWEVADGWKGGLSDSTRREGKELEAAYLGDVLREWETAHNRHPDLSARVILSPAEGIGTELLTGTQIVALGVRLDALPLGGVQAVELDEPALPARPPGAGFRLHVAGYSVAVPPDRIRPVQLYDPGPASFVIMGLLAVGDVLQMRVPASAAIACLGLYAVAAAWSHRVLRVVGRSARSAALVVASFVAVVVTVVLSKAARQHVSPAGAAMLPFVAQLDLLAILAGAYRATVSRYALWAAAIAAAVVVGLAWALHPGHHDPTALSNLVWPSGALLTAWRFSEELDKAVDAHVRDFAANDADADARAFRSGQLAVIDLVRRARDEAHTVLAALEASLPPPLYGAARDRLDEVDLRLGVL